MNTTILTHTVQGERMHIHIRLSDPCNNGHNDFAITADIWEKGAKRFTDNTIAKCGMCHEDILKKMPFLKIFVDLHLSDESGAPMYAAENGYYHMRHSSLNVFADYMRVSENTASNVRINIQSKEQFAKWVDTLRPQWKMEADSAKAMLAKLITNNTVTV